MKIRSKLLFAFLAVSLSTIILVSFLFYSNEKQNLTRQIFNHLESVASIQHNRIKAINRQNMARLELVASRTQLRISLRDYNIDTNPEQLEKITRNIEDARAALPDFRNICVVSLEGIVIASTDSKRIGKDISPKVFFIRGQTGFSGGHFFLDSNGNLMTHLSGPLFLHGQLLGVLVIESGIENIISSVSDYTGLGRTGETILARHLDSGDAQFIMPTRFNPHAALKLSVSKKRKDIPIIQAFHGYSHVLSDAVDYREVPVLAVTRYIEDTDWGLVVKIDLAEAMAPIVSMRNLIVLLIGVSALIIIFVSLYLSKDITQPIIRLTETARHISEGHYNVLADEALKDETGILARAFNKMTANLIQTQQTLENKVTELSESEEQIRNLLDSTAEAIYGLDKNGNCTFCNPSCLKMLGYQFDDDLLGKNIHQLIHHTRADGTQFPPSECKILQIMHNRNPVHLDTEVLWRADGSPFWAEYRAYPVVRNNEITGAVVTFTDISERKKAETEKEKLNLLLQQAQKMEAVGTLAGGIAHDFNNILAAMIGYAELARMKLGGRDDVVKDVGEVIRAGQRAKELVKQILTFSRQTEHERKPTEIYYLVKEALKLLRASIPSTIEIKENLDAKCGAVLVDPIQIHQVLMNLCTNAYHAMRETGGILGVELRRSEFKRHDTKVTGLEIPPGWYVKIEISDTGCGMDRNVMDRIFEPYFTTKNKHEGTGMGLALTHGIVKNHDGHISVYSEPGKGSTFRVFLPCVEMDAVHPATELEEKISGGSERILVVDDEESIVQMAQRTLENLGYQVTAMSNCVEALQLFSDNPEGVDLVITDMTMPQMTGAELSQKILAIRPDLPIVLCTGFSELINEKKAKAIGIREYVMKPLITRELAAVVRKLLDEKKVLHESSTGIVDA